MTSSGRALRGADLCPFLTAGFGRGRLQRPGAAGPGGGKEARAFWAGASGLGWRVRISGTTGVTKT